MGSTVLYATDRAQKKCRVGLVIQVARTDDLIVVHRMEPTTDFSLRVKWHKIYADAEGKDTLEPNAAASQAKLESSDVLEVITLSRDGVMHAKASHRFDRQHWTLDTSFAEKIAALVMTGRAGAEAPSRPGQEALWEKFHGFLTDTKVITNQLLMTMSGECHGMKVHWEPPINQPWLKEEFVDYLELWPSSTGRGDSRPLRDMGIDVANDQDV